MEVPHYFLVTSYEVEAVQDLDRIRDNRRRKVEVYCRELVVVEDALGLRKVMGNHRANNDLCEAGGHRAASPYEGYQMSWC